MSGSSPRRPRLAVYCDFSYRIDGATVTAQQAFSRFVEGLAPHCGELVLLGRLDPSATRFPNEVRTARFVPLPFYRSGADLSAVLKTVPAAIRAFWRVLNDVDVLWIMGPNPPQAILFVLLGMLRRRKVVLGVRQNLPELISHRRPGQPAVVWAARALEWVFRQLARVLPAVVVGPDLARRYAAGASVLSIYVSLLEDEDLLPRGADHRAYDGDELRMLSVGRLDPEKNPLLLADVLAEAVRRDPRWTLEVCGDGPLAETLDERAAELGVGPRLAQRGYVAMDAGLWDRYREAHVLLHVSMTEGVPQVILEAFAARLPVVATDVGGVGSVVAGRGLLAPVGDAGAAAAALVRLAEEPELRDTLVERAQHLVAQHTLAAECARLAAFLFAD